jgi:hypothetical protein
VSVVTWDGPGQRKFEAGVDHGVLYPLNVETALYDFGVAWNGLTAVNEKPGGAAANPQFADNIKYLNLLSAETFAGTIQAFTYPDEFGACDGTATPTAGVSVGQQARQTFGLCYRSKIGNDVSTDLGFKLHLVYGCLASPSEKDYSTINDSPNAVALSWDFNSSPITAAGLEPLSLLIIDSTKVDSGALSSLMDLLYGTVSTDPSLPPPDTIIALFEATITSVTLSPPTFNGAHTITIPSQTGVTYRVDGVVHAAGSQLLTTGQSKVVTASPNTGYKFNTPYVDRWMFTFVS